MNQTDFSEIIDCSASTVHAIESGRLDLSRGLADRIAIATFVSVEWLLANDKTTPIIDRAGDPYTEESYNSYQAMMRDTESTPFAEVRTPGYLLGYYEVMRRIVAAANLEKKQLAWYRLEKFFSEFVQEFAGHSTRVAPIATDNTLALVEKDLKASKRVHKILRGKTGYVSGTPEIRAIAVEIREHLKEIPSAFPYLP